MRLAVLTIIAALPCFATFTISSASVGSDGRTFTVIMNGTYTSGATGSCFSFSGGAAAQFNAAAVTVTPTVSSASVTVVSAAPGYKPDTLVVSLAAAPTCLMIGSSGAAASSSATATNGSDYYAFNDTHWATAGKNQGGPLISTDANGYPLSATWNSGTGSKDIKVTSSSGTAYVWGFQFNNAISLLVDGVVSSRVALASGTTYTEAAFTGFDAGAHTLSFRQSSAATSFGDAIVNAIRIPSAVLAGSAPATNPIVSACGPSTTDLIGSGGATLNIDQNYWGLMGVALGITVQGSSYSGQTLVATLAPMCPANMLLQNATSPAFGVEDNLAGNDLLANVALSSVTTAAQTIVTNTMGNAHPPAKLFVVGLYNCPGCTNAGSQCTALSKIQCNQAYTDAMSAGVTAAANANTTFIHAFNLPNGGPDWLNQLVAPIGGCGTGAPLNADTQNDNDHPCAATSIGAPGYGKIANRMAPPIWGIVSGSSFTVAGPITGSTGSASSPFTATIANGCTGCTWQDIITLASSNASDVICILGQSTCGVGTLALASGNGNGTFQFTVNAASAGARTINYSANMPEGWIAPTANTYTSNGSPPSFAPIF